MQPARFAWRVGAVVSALAVLTVPLPGAEPFDDFDGVSLKVSRETVLPGDTAQMKVFVTEPKPISTGRGGMSFDGFEAIDGIAVMSPEDDTFGVAVVNGADIALSLASPSATFGTLDDYPIVTVTGRVSPRAPLGVVFPFEIDPARLEFRDPSGEVYPTEVRNGSLTTAPAVSVHDVQPGSAELPAGAIVTILGTGFVPDTDIRFYETPLAAIRYVSSSRIVVILGRPARMHGMRIRVRNPDGSRTTYFSYQRTHRLGVSVYPIFRDAVPLFPFRSTLEATVELPGGPAGLALQNIQSLPAAVTADLHASDGTPLASVQVNVPANRFIVQEISELFQMSYESGNLVRVRADRPVQVMGVAVANSGSATPLLPRFSLD